MKIKVKEMPYEEVLMRRRPERIKPKRPNLFFRTVVRVLSEKDLRSVKFSYTQERMEEAGEGPWLILMNHSCFLDLEIVSGVLYPQPYGIVCTSDGFVGKRWLMRQLGCIPTQKFVSDFSLIKDMEDMLKKKTSVLMYPEASYTFDGCATPLPRHMGILLKRLEVPVIYIRTEGAFLRDPLYNGLQKRKVRVKAQERCLLTVKEIRQKSVEELDAILDEAFSFDGFAWQYENKVEITEPFRAQGLERILYRCAHCKTEGAMEGRDTRLTCHACGKQYELDTLGRLSAIEGRTEFVHIPDWYRWERDEVRRELEAGQYRVDIPVKIGMMVDYKAIYMVGDGRLIQDETGFTLSGCDGRLVYRQKPLASYSAYSDYFWYEIGDMVCIGNKETLYYCFPQAWASVTKIRMAAEELYKLGRAKKGKA